MTARPDAAPDPLADTARTATEAARRDRARGLGPLELLLADPDLTEIMVDGPGPILVDRDGRVEPSGFDLDAAELDLIIERILDPLGLHLDRSRPVVDARLADGSRVNIAIAPAAPAGPLVTIRRFSDRVLPLQAFGPDEVVELLRAVVEDRRTALVVGPTSSGKTSLLNALASVIGADERVVTIEDTAELRLVGPRVVALEARPPGREGVGEVTMAQLVRNALRMRPDRLVVGEVRGAEALDLALALSSGHHGSLATCHAGSATSALERLAVLARLGPASVPVEALRSLVAAAVDVVVTVDRRGPRRLVTAVDVVSDDPARAPLPIWSASTPASLGRWAA